MIYKILQYILDSLLLVCRVGQCSVSLNVSKLPCQAQRDEESGYLVFKNLLVFKNNSLKQHSPSKLKARASQAGSAEIKIKENGNRVAM